MVTAEEARRELSASLAKQKRIKEQREREEKQEDADIFSLYQDQFDAVLKDAMRVCTTQFNLTVGETEAGSVYRHLRRNGYNALVSLIKGDKENVRIIVRFDGGNDK